MKMPSIKVKKMPLVKYKRHADLYVTADRKLMMMIIYIYILCMYIYIYICICICILYIYIICTHSQILSVKLTLLGSYMVPL